MSRPKQKKTSKTLLISIIGMILFIAVLSYFSLIQKSSKSQHFFMIEFERIKEWFIYQIPILSRALIYSIVLIVCLILIRIILSYILKVTKKRKTVIYIFDNAIKYATAIIIIVIYLMAFGVNPIALFASLGLLGLIIGLAAQHLISDMISGLFIVFESELPAVYRSPILCWRSKFRRLLYRFEICW